MERTGKRLKRIVYFVPRLDRSFRLAGLFGDVVGAERCGGALQRVRIPFCRSHIASCECYSHGLDSSSLPHREFAKQLLIAFALAAKSLESTIGIDSVNLELGVIRTQGIAPTSFQRRCAVRSSEGEPRTADRDRSAWRCGRSCRRRGTGPDLRPWHWRSWR